MRGLMMDNYPLTLTSILKRTGQYYGKKQISTKIGPNMHRYTYKDFYARTNRLANALTKLGVQPGDRVATFAWNTYRHLELYFGVPCMGAVLHTLNLRLPPEQIIYIVNHAEDKVIVVDASLLPLLEKLAEHLKTVEHYVVMTDGPLQTSLPNAISYEELLASVSPEYAWPDLDENSACAMCYTSGTTGNPKGVLYSHRAMYLHALTACMKDGLGLSEQDIVMPVVPMFHAMAWGLAYSATMVGATQVFPGPHMQPADLAGLIQSEKITMTAGVPTLWLGLLNLLEKGEYDISTLRAMPVGGSAAPRSMIEAYQKKFGVTILHAWGMTETSPLGSIAWIKSYMEDWADDDKFAKRSKQGMAVPGVEMRGIDENGKEIPWDGKTMGELQVRGPWVISDYYKDERAKDAFMDGWFRTGDVVTIDDEGYMQIVDRTKDLVKSGGEWISTVDLENTLMSHPQVMEAAVIAVAHSKWQERPLAVVVTREDADQEKVEKELTDLLEQHFAKWQLPDAIEFVREIPKTSVGKFDKKVIRDQFKDYKLPTEA